MTDEEIAMRKQADRGAWQRFAVTDGRMAEYFHERGKEFTPEEILAMRDTALGKLREACGANGVLVPEDNEGLVIWLRTHPIGRAIGRMLAQEFENKNDG